MILVLVELAVREGHPPEHLDDGMFLVNAQLLMQGTREGLQGNGMIGLLLGFLDQQRRLILGQIKKLLQ